MCKMTIKKHADISAEFLSLKCWTQFNYLGATQSSGSSQHLFSHVSRVSTGAFFGEGNALLS